MNRATKKNNGVTLIELIISIGMLAVVVIAFSGMFVSGINTIAKSGNRSDGDNETQKIIESKILNPTAGTDENVVTKVENTDLKIKFGSKEIIVPGKSVESKLDDGKSTITFKTFVAN